VVHTFHTPYYGHGIEGEGPLHTKGMWATPREERP
jgi:hypothetical protein